MAFIVFLTGWLGWLAIGYALLWAANKIPRVHKELRDLDNGGPIIIFVLLWPFVLVLGGLFGVIYGLNYGCRYIINRPHVKVKH